MSGRRARTIAPTLALLGAALAAPARADLRPLTLYERVGRAPWVILAEVTDADDRFASLKTIEVIKGTYDKPAFRIVYRLENFLRKSYQEKLEFAPAERVVLFLKRYETDREDGKTPEKLQAEDLFAPAFGAQTKFTTPPEGESAYLEALREFAKVTAVADPVVQEPLLIGFLESPNPHVLQTGLEQVQWRRLATEEQVPLLLRLADHPRATVRPGALQILAQVGEDLRAAKRALPNRDDVVNRLKGKVVGDAGDLERAAAVKCVAVFAAEGERAFLEKTSKEDRSQLVRYEAGKALLEMAGR